MGFYPHPSSWTRPNAWNESALLKDLICRVALLEDPTNVSMSVYALSMYSNSKHAWKELDKPTNSSCLPKESPKPASRRHTIREILICTLPNLIHKGTHEQSLIQMKSISLEDKSDQINRTDTTRNNVKE